MDISVYYRLTNSYLGPGQSLNVIPDGSGLLQMSPTGDSSGQHWRLVSRDHGKYALRTNYLGESFSLDAIADGTNRPWMQPTSEERPGQNWTLAPLADGTFRLTNDFAGPGRSLNTYAGTNDPVLDTGDHTGQHWTLAKLDRVSGTVPIPALNLKGLNLDKTEGPTDFTHYARPRGTVKGVMIFVDFPDAQARLESAAATGQHLLGGGAAQQLYHDQSYGQLIFDVTKRSDLGWRRLSKRSTNYDFENFESQRSFIHDAASLFRPAEIRFSDYQMVFVVTPKTATHFKYSPAFNAPVHEGTVVQGHEIRLGVTFGQDSHTNRYINLVHEVGHLFGLPDLYPTDGGGAFNSKIGCWSIMSDIFHSVSFLGWHRHKNGWLPASRATYIRTLSAPWYGTISPLSGSYGLSMVVLPIDDPDHPSKVFVIELAQPVLGTNKQYWGEGVLVYTVDATVESGQSPVILIPRRDSDSSDYGYLYEAPFDVGDIAQAPGSASGLLTVTVLQKFGTCYNIGIEYRA